MAVSSLRRPLLRYSMTFASPCMVHSAGRGQVNRPLFIFRMFLNQIAGESNPIPKRALKLVRSSGGRERKLGIAVLMGSRVAVRASGAAGFGASAERFVDNGFDSARASATLGAAAEA